MRRPEIRDYLLLSVKFFVASQLDRAGRQCLQAECRPSQFNNPCLLSCSRGGRSRWTRRLIFISCHSCSR